MLVKKEETKLKATNFCPDTIGLNGLAKQPQYVCGLKADSIPIYVYRVSLFSDSYISYLQHTSDEDAAFYMSNRLCCAQVLKTLYMRHEQPYVNLVCGRSPSSSNGSTWTNFSEKDEERGHHPTVCDTCFTPLDDDLVFLSDLTDASDGQNKNENVHEYGDAQSMLSPSTLMFRDPISNFCRQKGGRVPVTAKRRSHRAGLSLSPVAVDKQHGVASYEERESRSLGIRDMSRCGSGVSQTPFTGFSAFQGIYEIY
ncbi:hypothetical protein PoB_004829200 [Plakobranchus ocellatus]|uniref:Uncharacterized protein n=1 Tax=Plakobranchus ocellatus TaxID=259542 RepID=A0AAV4BQZ3_9GAST|nr:hypothetical protein PoB_004829200 [Plakobranchus ocellatus]